MASSSLTPSKLSPFPSSSLKSSIFLFSPFLSFPSSRPPFSLPSFPSKSFTKPFPISSCLNPNPPFPQCRPLYTPNHIPDPNYVRIFDTTLRDGEQAPGAALTSKEKLGIARPLAKLGVDIIEAGFPAASEDDFEAVKTIAKEVGNAIEENGYVPVICGLSRCTEDDIRTTWEAVKYAKMPRVHTFIATSGIHLE
ncbi:hypothetical protein DITRI_Ditri15bG0038200 [Diplodiscus trichospermus]